MLKYEPDQLGSYAREDVVFLLRDISHMNVEIQTAEREKRIQSGTHYAEMLPVEYQPSAEYIQLFHHSLTQYAERLSKAVVTVAEKIMALKNLNDLVLVSLARAGTPIGILIKRYLLFKYEVSVPHYSISIIRGRGIDETAIRYILHQHPTGQIQFVDGPDRKRRNYS